LVGLRVPAEQPRGADARPPSDVFLRQLPSAWPLVPGREYAGAERTHVSAPRSGLLQRL